MPSQSPDRPLTDQLTALIEGLPLPWPPDCTCLLIEFSPAVQLDASIRLELGGGLPTDPRRCLALLAQLTDAAVRALSDEQPVVSADSQGPGQCLTSGHAWILMYGVGG